MNRGGRPSYEPVPLAERSLKDRIVQSLPAELPFTGDRGIKLRDVAEGLASMEDFVAQLTPEELEALTHGDFIMDSPLGTRGNAAVMGGITESLRAKGVPPVTTTDGPLRHPSAVLLLAPCRAAQPWPAPGIPTSWKASTSRTGARWCARAATCCSAPA